MWLTADPPFVFLTVLTSLSRRLLAHDLKTLVVARGKLARKLRRGHDFQTQSLLTGEGSTHFLPLELTLSPLSNSGAWKFRLIGNSWG